MSFYAPQLPNKGDIMADIYNRHIMTIDNNKIPILMYGKAYMLSHMRRGRLKGKEWKATVFFVVWLMCMFYMSVNRFHMSANPVPLGISIICLYMMTYYLFILPKRVMLEGEHIYKSSHMLCRSEKITVTRDGYTLQNKYETLCGYWTDMTDCIETSEYFLLLGEYSKRLIIVSKKSIDDEKTECLRDFFKKTMTVKYRKVKK